jgi:hypothetical protein
MDWSYADSSQVLRAVRRLLLGLERTPTCFPRDNELSQRACSWRLLLLVLRWGEYPSDDAQALLTDIVPSLVALPLSTRAGNGVSGA